MVKRIIVIAGIFLSCLVSVYAQTTSNKKSLRLQLVNAITSSKTTDSLYNSLKAVHIKSPLITGYIGTLQALKAKHHWNPYYKLKYVKDAQKSFAKAIESDPHSIELRFLRFSVDHKLPRLLGYTKNMEPDKSEILAQLAKKNYPPEDKELVIAIINFLLENNIYTPNEHTYLTKQLALLK